MSEKVYEEAPTDEDTQAMVEKYDGDNYGVINRVEFIVGLKNSTRCLKEYNANAK
jgi:Ca2+-binding EF-hand superfamily protein